MNDNGLSKNGSKTHWDINIDPSGLSFTFQALHDFAADIRKGASPRLMEFGGGPSSAQDWYGFGLMTDLDFLSFYEG